MNTYPTITVHAPRKRPLDPARPLNEVILFSIDHHHPGGKAFLAEGDEADVWPGDPRVKELIGTGALVKGPMPRDRGGKPAETLDPESLHAIGLAQGTVDALAKVGVTSTTELVDVVVSGDIEDTTGIGKARRAEIIEALERAGRIEPSEEA